MMNEEQKDIECYGNAIDRMNSLGAFDREGLHADNWGRLRSAAHLAGPKSRCSWPGCNADVVGSHTISRSSGLGPIQRNQHVLMPDLRELPVSMTMRGQRQATVFPGFCDSHEQKFQVFEKDGVLDSTSDFALQLFRSTTREYSNKAQRYAYFRAVWDEYHDVLSKRPKSPVDPDVANEVLNPLESMMKRTREEAQWLGALWRACYDLTVFRDATSTKTIPVMISRVHLETSRRIALSGSTFIDAQADGMECRIPVVVTILPAKTGVDVLFVTIQGAADQYEINVQDMSRTDGGDAFVDEWLVQTEWWCADPEWWQNTDSTWQATILNGLGSV